MSFLKRLFSGNKPAQVPRAPRIKVGVLHRVAFRPTPGREGSPLLLSNISTRGMGLLRRGDTISVGQKLKGNLEINKESFDLEAEVKHQTAMTLGCEFQGSFDAVSRAVEEYFKLEICALKLNKVDEAYLKRDPAGQVTWFTDGKQNEVYLVSDSNGVASFHLSFLGNYVEGGRGKVLRAGHIVEDDRMNYRGSDMLELTADVSDQILAHGRTLVANVGGLSDESVQQLQSFLAKK